MNTEKKHIIVAGVPRTGKTLSICKALEKNRLLSTYYDGFYNSII